MDDETRVDAYVSALRRDPDTPVPDGLDPDFARFVRVMALTHSAQLSQTQARIWQQAYRTAQKQRSGQQVTRRVSMRPGVFAALAALLIVIVAAGNVFQEITHRQRSTPPVQTPAFAGAGITSATPSPAATPAPPTNNTPHFEPLQPPAPAPSSIESPPVITAQNADHLHLMKRIGKGAIHDITWTADRQEIAISSSSGIWLYKTGALDSEGQHFEGLDAAMDRAIFSPDGKTLVSANAENVVIWDVAKAQAIALLHSSDQKAPALTFSPDGKILATGGKTIRLWNMATRSQVGEMGLTAADTFVNCLAFSPDGAMLAAGLTDSTLSLLDVAIGHVQTTLEETDHTRYVGRSGITAVAFSPDGKTLVTGSASNWVRIWDVGSSQLQASRADLLEGVSNISFSPDGNTVAYTDGESAWMWQYKTTRDPAFLEKATRWESVVYNADGTRMALGLDDNGWRLWNDKPSRAALNGFTADQPLKSVTFSSDGSLIAAAGQYGAIWLWNRTDHAQIADPHNTDHYAELQISPDGQWVAAGGLGKIELWDWEKDQYRILQDPVDVGDTLELGFVTSLAFSPDGKLLASGGDGSTQVVLWNVASGDINAKVASQGYQDRATSAVTFSADGSLLAYGIQGSIFVWDTRSRQIYRTLKIPGYIDVRRGIGTDPLAMSKDGTTLAAVGADPNTIQLWDISRGSSRMILKGHSGLVTGIAFNPAGNLLATSSLDGSVRLWDVSTGSTILVLQPQIGSVYDVAFSPDGSTLAASGDHGLLYLWQIAQ